MTTSIIATAGDVGAHKMEDRSETRACDCNVNDSPVEHAPLKPQPSDHVEVGGVAPDFCLPSAEGKTYNISDFRGKKVMLCFYNSLHCPICAYLINELIGRYKLLAWAAQLKVIIVVRNSIGALQSGLTDPNAPLQVYSRDNNGGNFAFPFLGLADPDGVAASKYQVRSQLKNAFRRIFEKYFRQRSKYAGKNGIHSRWTLFKESIKYGGTKTEYSEFLINEDGIIFDAFRATKPGQSMGIDRVTHFLLHDQQSPSANDNSHKKKSNEDLSIM